MKELNYSPNEVARSLSKRTTNNIGVIVPHISHPYFAEMISNLENAANGRGYKILLCNSRGEDNREREFLEMCICNRVAGIILFSAGVAVEGFASSNIPLITVERYVENGTAAVECDNRQGGRLAAQCLIDAGCRNILHVSGVLENTMPADDRAKGFIEVCDERGIAHYEVATNLGQYYSLDYHEQLETILVQDGMIDGIFASSDLIAAQILQVCSKLGKRVPEDIKLIGFDDVLLSKLSNPPITTIHQPIKEMATMAVDLLIKATKNETVPKRSLLPVSLVVRESTK